MKTVQGQSENVPQARISLNDARIMLAMVKAYLAYLRNAVPPSHKRDTQIRVLQGVCQRLAAVLASPCQVEDTPIWLTQPELKVLEEAMSGFVQLVREIVPASNLRDETLREIEGFRDNLNMMLSRTQS